MAFEDIKESKLANEGGQVHVYLTAHFASFDDDSSKQSHDTVRYAIGDLEANPVGLAGDLPDVFANTLQSPFVGSFKRPHEPVAHRGHRA